jgi:hypothetical protein
MTKEFDVELGWPDSLGARGESGTALLHMLALFVEQRVPAEHPETPSDFALDFAFFVLTHKTEYEQCLAQVRSEKPPESTPSTND